MIIAGQTAIRTSIIRRTVKLMCGTRSHAGRRLTAIVWPSAGLAPCVIILPYLRKPRAPLGIEVVAPDIADRGSLARPQLGYNWLTNAYRTIRQMGFFRHINPRVPGWIAFDAAGHLRSYRSYSSFPRR